MSAPMRTYLLPLLMFAVACGAAAAQSSSDKIIEESLKPSPLETNLQQLTDQVGGRVPGTPAFDRAVTWAETAFRPREQIRCIRSNSRLRNRGRKEPRSLRSLLRTDFECAPYQWHGLRR